MSVKYILGRRQLPACVAVMCKMLVNITIQNVKQFKPVVN